VNPAFATLAAALAAPPAWLAPYAPQAAFVLKACAAGSVPEALNAALPARGLWLAAGRLRFVPQAALPEGEAYEAFIVRTACIPTRDNLHDLFNGMVWLHHPAIKRRLNELQAEQLARRGADGTRGAVRDALTLFDENGAWWQAPPVLHEALRMRDWHALFITHRAAWRNAGFTVFGHALLEKLLVPRKNITAHLWAAARAPQVDDIAPAMLSAKPFLPLPVMGIPGWCAANGSPTFYDDASVFRPSGHNRAREASQTAAGAISERRHWRKVRTAQGGVAVNGCPP